MANPTAGRNESSKNRTLANATTGYSYKNPVIPQGFKAVDIGEGKWSYTDSDTVTGWNEGLVIEDVYNGNQFVWVPVDGTNVVYAKNFALDSGGVKTDVTDDTSAFGVSIEENQIGTYGGFYVARFEAGNPDAVNSSTAIDESSTNNIGTKAPVSKLGVKAWNYIDYNNAVAASNLMVNDSSKYGNNRSGLITGKQWDTILAWYIKDGIGVEKTTQKWGSYSDLEYTGKGNYFTYDESTVSSWINGENFSHIASTLPHLCHATGANEDAMQKNIYDLGGNMWEWTTEVYSDNYIHRGGGAWDCVSNSSVSSRSYGSMTSTYFHIGFRTTLYIL